MSLLSDFKKGSPETSVMHPFHAIRSGSGIKPSTGKKLTLKEENKLWKQYSKRLDETHWIGFPKKVKKKLTNFIKGSQNYTKPTSGIKHWSNDPEVKRSFKKKVLDTKYNFRNLGNK